MKLLDKYILRTLLVPMAYCLIAFAMLYIVYDLFQHMEDFIEAKTPVPLIAQYYAMLLPSALFIIAPISILLSILYSLSQLTKNNEITAMRASGVSIYRVLSPCVIIGLLASIAVAFVQETVAPYCATWTSQFLLEERKKEEIDVNIVNNLPYRNPYEHRTWLIGRFDKKNLTLEKVSVIQQREDGSEAYQVHAEEARFLDGRWWFMQAALQRYDPQSHPMGPPQFSASLEMPDLTETPRLFLNETKDDPYQLSSREIHHYIQTHQHLDASILARYAVDLQHRLALPWTCLVVTLIGLPFGTHTGRKGALAGILLCFVLFFSYYVLQSVGLALGKDQAIPAWAAAWTPNVLYAFIGLALIYRMR